MQKWQLDQRNVSRSVCLTVTNTSSYTLLRAAYSLDSGVWSEFPPEKILPNSTVVFGAQANGFMTGSSGYVNYIHDEELLSAVDVQLSWYNPFFGTKSASGQSDSGFFAVKESITPADHMDVKWSVKSKLSQVPSESKRKHGRTLTPSRSPSTRTKRFHSNEWKNVVARSSRSVVATIDNKTRFTLKRVDQQILTGGWALVPPEEIGPNSVGGFAAHSRGIMGGVSGQVTYQVDEKESTLNFNNPFMGLSAFDANSTRKGKWTTDVKKGSQANVTYTVTQARETQHRKKSSSSKFRVLTLNTGLNKTRDNSLPHRGRVLLKALKDSDYDVLCLQGVYNPKAVTLFLSSLKSNFPYQVDAATTEGSGMLVLSKFPLLGSNFKLFGNGVGSDVLRVKGIVHVKLDLSSLFPRKVLHLFSTHAQADPSKQSEITDVENANKVRERQFNLMAEFVHVNVQGKTKSSMDLPDFAVLLVGDFCVPGEFDYFGHSDSSTSTKKLTSSDSEQQDKEQAPKESGEAGPNGVLGEGVDADADLPDPSWDAEERTSKLISQVHAGERNILFSSTLPPLFTRWNIGFPQYPSLRQSVTEPRLGLIILLAVVWQVVEQELFEALKRGWKKKGEAEAKKHYVDICLLHTHLLFGRPISSDPSHGLIEQFWTDVIKSLREKSGETILSEQECDPVYLSELCSLYSYQLLRLFITSTGLQFSAESKAKLFEGTSRELTSKDLKGASLDAMSPLWSRFREHFLYSTNNVLEAVNAPVGERWRGTAARESLLRTLGTGVHDCFREKNPEQVGFTVLGAQNTLVKSKKTARRQDYIFSFDSLGDSKLLQLRVSRCKVVPFGDTADTQLSPHYAVGALLGFLG
eukprot:TRINITY_DN1296_c0_g1_i1.p1 TRINITY_DN1296_c0_g1~~TRINITY_DN1296_c0_g1_i1.p1  ORF type:complete len:924 (+),score=145.55 TRINITY_DN1296_c0_g1_i1:185-2773(+)